MATAACFLNIRLRSMEVTGIILAGGKSTRMGADKGLELLAGKPLITYAIQALAPHCQNIIISTGSDAYSHFGFQVVADEFPGIGPMGGVYSSLNKSKTLHNLVLSCDLPFVSSELLAFILKQSVGFETAVPWYENNYYEPLCGYYSKQITDTLFAFIECKNYKLPDVFEKIRINKLRIDSNLPFFHDRLFMNVNSKEELAAARKILQDGFF